MTPDDAVYAVNLLVAWCAFGLALGFLLMVALRSWPRS